MCCARYVRLRAGSTEKRQFVPCAPIDQKRMQTVWIEPIQDSPDADAALEALLHESYVGGGFTPPEVAATMFRAGAVRSRGMVLVAHDRAGAMLGTVTLVTPDSPARRLASADEVEFHILCVRPDMRGKGIGRALVEAALIRAASMGVRGVVLWTQPTMNAAHRLYEHCGFHRDPAADFTRDERQYLVYRRSLAADGKRDSLPDAG